MFNENEQGSSCTRNRGIKEAKGVYIAYMDDDAKATSTWCENILNAFNTITPKPVAVGGKILPYYKIKPPYWFNDELEIRSWGDSKKFLKKGNGYFSGANMSFQKSILVQFNGFSTKYGVKKKVFITGEERELMQRIFKKHPHLFYDPSIIIYHLVKEKNIKIIGRLKRAYKSGLSRYSLFEGRDIEFIVFNFSRLIYHILCLLYYLFTFKYNAKFIHSLEMSISKITSIIGLIKNKLTL